MADTAIREIPIEELKYEDFVQLRAANSTETVERYAQPDVVDKLPALKAFEEPGHLWVWDGIHTYMARVKAGKDTVSVQVEPGTRLDALIAAAGANHEHGLPRTRADVQHAINRLLDEKDGSGLNWSNRDIARMVRCDHETVNRVAKARKAENEAANNGQAKENVANIAKKDNAGRKSGTGPAATQNGQPPAAQEDAPKDDDDDEGTGAGTLLDEDGLDLPPQAVEAFNALPELRRLLKAMDDLGKEIERIGKSPLGACMYWDSARSSLKAARKTMYQGRPAHVCPYCKGKDPDCNACRGRGWVTKAMYEQRPDQERKAK
jgi:hypothetical protein